MNLKNFPVAVGMIILVSMLILFSPPISGARSSAEEPMPLCATANAGCAKQKAILRQLERTRPSKKLTRQQIFNRIKAACDKMRNLDCPGIRNYQPSICFTDF